MLTWDRWGGGESELGHDSQFSHAYWRWWWGWGLGRKTRRGEEICQEDVCTVYVNKRMLDREKRQGFDLFAVRVCVHTCVHIVSAMAVGVPKMGLISLMFNIVVSLNSKQTNQGILCIHTGYLHNF